MKWRKLVQPHVLVAAAVGALGVLVWESTRPPTKILTTAVEAGIITPGGKIVVLYHAVKSNACSATVSRFLYEADVLFGKSPGPIYYPLVTSAPPPVPLGDVYYGMALEAPKDAPSGDYYYQTRTDYFCGILFHPSTVYSKPARMHLTAATPSSPAQVVVTPPGQAVTVQQGPMP